MSSKRNPLPLVLAFALLSAFAFAQAKPAPAPLSAFDQLKSLVGEWEGSDSTGNPGKLSYSLASGGSVVMEHLMPAGEPEMITMYSADGNRLVVTHYCSAGNQPQMQTEPLTGAPNKIVFSLVRVTGLKTPDEGRMIGLTLTIPDRQHLTQEWTYLDKGKTQTEAFSFTRKN